MTGHTAGLTTELEFSKGHGTGNDFVIVPDPDGELVLTPDLVAGLCDRRFGIGGDGLLRVVRTAALAGAGTGSAPAVTTAAAAGSAAAQSIPDAEPAAGAEVGRALAGASEWFMDYRNADGSVAEMCGNGARVFARYLVDTGLVAAGELTLGTRAGPVLAVVTEAAVSVTMGVPQVLGGGTARLASAGSGGVRELSGTAVDCGNPHLVCPVPAGLDLAGLDLSMPPVVDPHQFPDGVNVEFVAGPPGEPVGPGHVRMRVHERGSGETRSCGSGACAVAAVVLREAGRRGGVVTVDVPGGRLTVSIGAGECVLTGPAVLVAHGSVDVSSIAGHGVLTPDA